VRRDILQETFRLLARHFDLFTLVALTVWLPGHLVINYLDFFTASKDTADAAARGFRVGLMVEAIFGPLVVAATLAALARIKRGEPASYAQVLVDGLVAWPRLFIARLVVSVLVLAGLVALVVVDGAPLRAALRASNALTAGRRPAIFWTLGVLFAAVFSLAMSLSALAGAAHHFVVQVLTDCVIAVTQTVFTIALFLFYREARIAAATSAPAPPAD
jgi:hypothetical protein